MSRVIVTPRLVLRPWHRADLPAALRIYTDPQVAKWLPAGLELLQTLPGLESRLADWSREQTGDDCAGHWAVAERSSSAVVGAVSLEYLRPDGGSLTMRWALASCARGHGYAAEAGDRLARWAIHVGGAIEVFALIPPDNAAATATAERIGMNWVAEAGHVAGHDRYQVFRIRHGDLDDEDDADEDDGNDQDDGNDRNDDPSCPGTASVGGADVAG
jgi:RimJ/RimL family protein N-acetyltransferase